MTESKTIINNCANLYDLLHGESRATKLIYRVRTIFDLELYTSTHDLFPSQDVISNFSGESKNRLPTR